MAGVVTALLWGFLLQVLLKEIAICNLQATMAVLQISPNEHYFMTLKRAVVIG